MKHEKPRRPKQDANEGPLEGGLMEWKPGMEAEEQMQTMQGPSGEGGAAERARAPRGRVPMEFRRLSVSAVPSMNEMRGRRNRTLFG